MTPMSVPWISLPQFASEIQRLDWLVRRVIDEISIDSTHDTPNHLSTDEYREFIEVAAVAGCFVRQILEFARLILRACEKSTPSAAGATERSLYEYWADFRYLLSHGGSRYENALRLQLDASLDFMALLEVRGQSADQDLTAKVGRAVDIWKNDHPDIFAAVSAQRKRKPVPHWSGESRSSVFRIVDGQFAWRIYKMLSWESHPIMGPARDWQIQMSAIEGGVAARVICQPSAKPEQLSEPMCYRAGGMLLSTWNQFADDFGGNAIVGPYQMISPLSSAAPSNWMNFSRWTREQ